MLSHGPKGFRLDCDAACARKPSPIRTRRFAARTHARLVYGAWRRYDSLFLLRGGLATPTRTAEQGETRIGPSWCAYAYAQPLPAHKLNWFPCLVPIHLVHNNRPPPYKTSSMVVLGGTTVCEKGGYVSYDCLDRQVSHLLPLRQSGKHNIWWARGSCCLTNAKAARLREGQEENIYSRYHACLDTYVR